MTNTNSDPDYYLPSSYSFPKLHIHNENTKKKRSKMLKLEPLMASSSSVITTATATNSGNAKKYYSKKPDPSAPKITRPCTECGKKFWSWKALFGHMRCHPERQWRGINPPTHYRKPFSPNQEFVSEEKESAIFTEEEYEVASCLLLLASSSSSDDHVGNAVLENGFECSCCKKVFGSHQALGGHRASHKNVKGCFANTRSSEDVVNGEELSNESVDVKRLMVLGHKCSICMRVFSSGQALGGHKRCHWEKGEETSSSTLMNNNQGFNVFPSCGGFDLNLPAPVEDDQSSSSYSSALNSPTSLALDLRLGL